MAMRAQRRPRPTFLLTGTFLVVAILSLAACGTGSSSSLQTLATFQGSGDGETAHFTTGGP
jgi:hypothetical protein